MTVEVTQSDLNVVRRNFALDASYWAANSSIRLQKGMYDFAGREYLIEPMRSTFRRRAYLKGTQGGGSTAEILKTFHGMIYGYLSSGALYLFPTSDDMQDYSKAVMGPLVAMNPHVLGKWVKNVKGTTDAASLKTVNGANLFMRGAGLTKIIEGEAVGSKLTGISVDKVVFDEIEFMDKLAIAKALERMGDSDKKEEVYIGNPGPPGRGIDEIFNGSKDFRGSDQRHWFRKCLHCGEWTCAELEFPGCVKIRKDGTGFIGCKKCGKEVFVRDGHWDPQKSENSDYMHGYRWSQLTSPNNDPAEILAAFNDPPHGNLQDVYRLKLAVPYVAAENRLTIARVRECCGDYIMRDSDDGPCAFGLDVGKICRLVIGKRTGKKAYKIVKVARLSDWNDISNMVKRFNCKSGVIDIRPYENTARQFQKTHTKMRIFLCEYSETTPNEPSFNKNTGVVKVNRTEICDRTHDLIEDEGLIVFPQWSQPEIKQFAREVCDPVRKSEINKKTKIQVFRYDGREDHYRHALNYFLLAASGHKIAVAKSVRRHSQPKTVFNDYSRV